jgi:hypothetical protein
MTTAIQKYDCIAAALSDFVRAGITADHIPALSAVQLAMIEIWYGTESQILAGAEMIARTIGRHPDIPQDVPHQWIVDGVLYNAGHRLLMKSIPSIAAEMLVSINGSTHAFTVMWRVGEVLEHDIAEKAWEVAASALKQAGFVGKP